jgi:hypothetical protein
MLFGNPLVTLSRRVRPPGVAIWDRPTASCHHAQRGAPEARRPGQHIPDRELPERILLRPVLGRVRRRPLMVDELAEVAHVDPAAAFLALDEMLGLILGRRADDELAHVFSARDAAHDARRYDRANA